MNFWWGCIRSCQGRRCCRMLQVGLAHIFFIRRKLQTFTQIVEILNRREIILKIMFDFWIFCIDLNKDLRRPKELKPYPLYVGNVQAAGCFHFCRIAGITKIINCKFTTSKIYIQWYNSFYFKSTIFLRIYIRKVAFNNLRSKSKVPRSWDSLTTMSYNA